MKNDKELTGTLQGFDDYVNMVLSDVVEYSSYDGDGKRTEKRFDKCLVNGNNVAVLVPGGGV